MVEIFRDDEAGYEAWLLANPRGYVVNIDEIRSTGTRLHKASCHTLARGAGGGQLRTSSYPKACSKSPSDLDAWHRTEHGEGLRELCCRTCEPSTLGLS